MPENELQVDHRVPFEIAGEQDIDDLDAVMLLSPSANRKKSWTCEHCSNWLQKSIDMCMECFWAYPDHYKHVGGKNERVVILHLTGEEARLYDNLVGEFGREVVDGMIKENMAKYFVK